MAFAPTPRGREELEQQVLVLQQRVVDLERALALEQEVATGVRDERSKPEARERAVPGGARKSKGPERADSDSSSESTDEVEEVEVKSRPTVRRWARDLSRWQRRLRS